jgi:hypothetical protein
MDGEFLEGCRLGAKITLAQCQKRQLKFRRYDVRNTLTSRFYSCVNCPNWLSDSEFASKGGFTDGRWVYNGKTLVATKGGSGKCRRN